MTLHKKSDIISFVNPELVYYLGILQISANERQANANHLLLKTRSTKPQPQLFVTAAVFRGRLCYIPGQNSPTIH